VLTVLFSLTSNLDLLGLHAHQQHPRAEGENAQSLSGWIKVLALALQEHLGTATDTLLRREEHDATSVQNLLASKLDGLFKLLGLNSYSDKGVFLGKLKSVDKNDIAPVQILCPRSVECETADCKSQAILKYT
jgi:hypothetical protein